MTILVYARPWNKEQFLDLASKIWPDSDISMLSEHKSVDNTGFIKIFYEYFENSKELIRENLIGFFDDAVIQDIIIRCRLLRGIDKKIALRLIYSAFHAIDDILSEKKPDYVLSVTVDSYIIDILARLAKQKSIKFIGLVPTFVDGYFRITERGEKAINRDVSEEEVKSVLEMLKAKEYKPQWLASDYNAIKRKAYRYWSRNLIKPLWFYIYSKFKKDPLNYHYMASSLVAKKYFSITPRLYNCIDSIDSVKSKVDSGVYKSIFLPLQMSPEATIDYWSSDTSWIDYESKILKTVDEYKNSFTFVIKEHPNVFGFRTNNFYSALINKANVILVNPEVSSNELIEACDYILVCTGTVGFESLLRGKPVISGCAPYYASRDGFLNFDDLDIESSMLSEYELVEYLLSGFLPGTFINDGSWSKELELTSSSYNSLVAKSIKDSLSNSQ